MDPLSRAQLLDHEIGPDGFRRNNWHKQIFEPTFICVNICLKFKSNQTDRRDITNEKLMRVKHSVMGWAH